VFSAPASRMAFLPPLSDVQVGALQANLEPVYRTASAWVRRFKVLESDTVLPASVIKVAQLPGLPASSVALAVEWEVWIFAFDDLLDRDRMGFAEVEEVMEEAFRIAVAPPGSERFDTPFGASFLEIKSGIAGHATFSDLQPVFVAGLVKALEGMAFVAQPFLKQGEGSKLVSLAEYLHHATNSFVHPFLWCIALHEDSSALLALSDLVRLARRCGRACRLANDLSTFDREHAEQVLNSVQIVVEELRRDGAPDGTQVLERAREIVQAQLDREQLSARELASRIRTRSGVEESFIRLMDLSVGAYARADVRNWKAALSGQGPPDRGPSPEEPD
jgi:hypothetical protein